MRLAFGRDGAVQNAVDKARDGGHRGFQLVRHIGDKAAAHILHAGQRDRHIVQRGGQFGNLVFAGDRIRMLKSPSPKRRVAAAISRSGRTNR
jgi:hypothetical protein